MPGMEKSPDAFRTISEVADWLGVPTHVLRFWESRFTQVKPVKRAGGRRYYRPSDMELIGGIKRLLHDDGMTIRGVQKLLREKGVRHVAGLSPPLYADIEDAELIEADTSPAESAEAQDDATVVAFERPEATGLSEPPEDVAEDTAEDVAVAPLPEVEEASAPAPEPVPDAGADVAPDDESGIAAEAADEIDVKSAADETADAPTASETEQESSEAADEAEPEPEPESEPEPQNEPEPEAVEPENPDSTVEEPVAATAEDDLFDRLAPEAEVPAPVQPVAPIAADAASASPADDEIEEDTGDDDLVEEPALSVASRLRIAAHGGLSSHAETLSLAQARLVALRDRMDGRG